MLSEPGRVSAEPPVFPNCSRGCKQLPYVTYPRRRCRTLNTREKPMNDIHIVDVEPGDELASIDRVRELVAETGAPSVAFMVTAVPNEQALDDRLQDWVHRFSLLREGLKNIPVRVGILIQALIGHGDRNRIAGVLPFQNIVGADGVTCRESFCPLDADFQAYADQLIQTLAKAVPDFFMIDDDFRIGYHAPAHKGCMCPLHLARLSQRLGTRISREDLLSRFEEEECNELRDQWEKLKEDSLVELAGVIRSAIDTVDDAIRGMFCCVTSEVHLAPAIANTLAGRHQPVVRINNAVYLESGHKDFPRRVTQTFHQIARFSTDTTVLTEADTYPHNRYSLSVKSHLAHVVATTLAGCHGAKYWFVKTDEDGWQETAPFRHMLAHVRPFFNEVEKIRDSVSWLGPVVVGRLEEILRKPWKQQGAMAFLSDDWGWRIFGRMGIPFTINTGDDAGASPRALCRTAPLAYTDDELLGFLSGPLLLDGEAAWHFCDRGLGKHVGVMASPSSFACSVERMQIFPESKRKKEAVSNMTGDGCYLLAPQSEDTRTVSSFATGSQAAYNTIAPALTWYRNKLGGRIAVYGISMRAPLERMFFNSIRKAQLLETLTWLAEGTPPVVVETDLDVYVLHGKDNTADKGEYACLFNLNPDTIEKVRIALPGRKVTSIEKLSMSGQWKPVSFTTEGQSIRCDADAPTMEPFILRLGRRGA